MKWYYDPEDDFHNTGNQCFVTGDNGETICVVENNRKDLAAIIRAAPQLLEACRQVLGGFQYEKGRPIMPEFKMREILQEAVRAVDSVPEIFE